MVQGQRYPWEEPFMGALALVSIVLIFVMSFVLLTPGWQFTLYSADFIICITFAFDFAYRYIKAARKSDFLKLQAWELLTMIPALALSTSGRLIMIAAVLRALRLARAIWVLARETRYFKNTFNPGKHRHQT